MTDETSSHFKRFTAFVRGGWLGRLKPIQAAVWLAYESHASADGISRPGCARLQRYLGHKKGEHIREARLALCTLGLMELVSRGGGRDAAVYRVLLPPSPDLGESPDLRETPNAGGPPSPVVGESAPLKPGGSPSPKSAHTSVHRSAHRSIHEVKNATSLPARRSRVTDSSPVVMTFSIKGGKTWDLRQSTLDSYVRDFRTVDVLAEFGKARRWCEDTPTRRKTAAGMPRFLTGWLTRNAGDAKPEGAAARPAWADEPGRSATAEDMVVIQEPPKPGEPYGPDDLWRYSAEQIPENQKQFQAGQWTWEKAYALAAANGKAVPTPC